MPRNSVGVAVMQGPTSGQCSCQIFMTAGTRPQDPDPEEEPARTTVGSHGVRPDRHSSVRLPPPPPAGCTSVEVVGGWGCRFRQSAEGRGPRVTGGLCGVHLRALGGRLGGSPFASRRLLLHSSQPGRSLGRRGRSSTGAVQPPQPGLSKPGVVTFDWMIFFPWVVEAEGEASSSRTAQADAGRESVGCRLKAKTREKKVQLSESTF